MIASDDLKARGVYEMSEEALADELARRHEYEYEWHITPHTSSVKLAFHDWDGTYELRWNRGDIAATLLRFDDEKFRHEKLYASDFVLRAVLGVKWPDDMSAPKKAAEADWAPVHRRLWELSAFLCGYRGADELASV